MSTVAFIAVILSALFHSGYNLLIKVSDEKTLYMWSIFSVAVITGWIAGCLMVPGFLEIQPSVLLFAALSAAFFTCYHLSAARAYAADEGDLSLSYPLTTLAPVFIPFWAYLLLGDTFTIKVIAGILMATAGTYLIQLNFAQKRVRIRSLGFGSEAVRFALLASFLYSFGGISDKIGVSQSGFYMFTVWLMTMIFIYFTSVVLLNKRIRSRALHCYRNYPLKVLLGGFLLFFSNISYRFGLEATDVSYAAGVRQCATLFAVLMGVFLLKEPYGLFRFMAGLIIALGIVLIKIG
ncbi:MAG: DMT family transporter [Desulfobacterales bacterium]|jgi:drug/metabolite transporter (DMT)-like permease